MYFKKIWLGAMVLTMAFAMTACKDKDNVVDDGSVADDNSVIESTDNYSDAVVGAGNNLNIAEGETQVTNGIKGLAETEPESAPEETLAFEGIVGAWQQIGSAADGPLCVYSSDKRYLLHYAMDNAELGRVTGRDFVFSEDFRAEHSVVEVTREEDSSNFKIYKYDTGGVVLDVDSGEAYSYELSDVPAEYSLADNLMAVTEYVDGEIFEYQYTFRFEGDGRSGDAAKYSGEEQLGSYTFIRYEPMNNLVYYLQSNDVE